MSWISDIFSSGTQKAGLKEANNAKIDLQGKQGQINAAKLIKELSGVQPQTIPFKNNNSPSIFSNQNEQTTFNGLQQLLANEQVRAEIDTNYDGNISEEELVNFLNFCKDLDGNGNDISLDDLYMALQEMSDNQSLNPSSLFNPNSFNPNLPFNLNSQFNPYTTNAGAWAGNYGRGGGFNPAGRNSAPGAPRIEELSLDELNKQKDKKTTELKTAQDNTQRAYNGETEATKKAQEDYDKAKKEYEETIQKNENISKELKKELSDKQQEIDDTKNKINKTKSDINAKENEITSQKSTIESDKANIQAIQDSISNLQSQKSDKEETRQLISSKLAAAQTKLKEAQAKLKQDEEKLNKLENDKKELNETLKTQQSALAKAEGEKANIEQEILKNDTDGSIKKAQDAVKKAEQNLEAVKEKEIAKAKEAEAPIQQEIDKINKAINARNVSAIKKELSINRLDDPKQLYDSMGLAERGLSYEAFEMAINGYNNLDDNLKTTGMLGVFDTSQPNTNKRYYLLDLNNFELVAQDYMATGSGNMTNIAGANMGNSHATLSGFEQVGEEYYSGSMHKKAKRLRGVEYGINNNAFDKGAVVHYTLGNRTWGCKGFKPVINNGCVDYGATYRKMDQLFPTGAMVFTCPPTNASREQYRRLSRLQG